MNTTSSSTAIDDAWRERRLGADLWGKTKPLLDELDRLREELQRRQQAAAAKACDMREKRSRHLRACTLVVARRHRLQLAGWTGSAHGRAVWLRKRIGSEIKLAVSQGKKQMLPKPPTVAFIAHVLNTVSFFVRT